MSFSLQTLLQVKLKQSIGTFTLSNTYIFRICCQNSDQFDVITLNGLHLYFKMKSKIYLFSGLGADHRVFKNIELPNHCKHIPWQKQFTNHNLQNYASKIIQTQIKTQKPILIGLSFGGILAVEIAKQIPTQNVIIIASAKNYRQIPFPFRLAGKLSLHKLIPNLVLTKSNPITQWLFGVESQEQKELLKNILAETDPDLVRWGFDQIVHWQNQQIIKNLTHIHGNKDRILPYWFVRADATINGGGHFLTLNKNKEVSMILREILKTSL